MKVFISADIEGITGVTSWDETLPGERGYDAACEQMNKEVAAACRAAMDLGYDVVVKDGHDAALNLDINSLPSGVSLIRGWMTSPDSMMGGLDESYQAAMYIGYHSPEGSDTSCLAHTIEHGDFNWIKLNGELASEFTLNKLIADSYGVPSVFLSGDRGICHMAEEQSAGIVTVETKDSVGGSTWNRPPETVIQDIYSKVKEALQKDIAVKPLEEEYTITINFKEHRKARNASWYPGAVKLDSNTVEYTAKTPFEMRVAQMFMTGL